MRRILEKKLKPEYKALWEISKQYKIDYALRRALQEAVREARYEAQLNKEDPLAKKLERFGNGGGWGEHQMRELTLAVYRDKTPDNIDLGQWISVEVECILPHKRAETEFVAFVRKNGWSKFVTIKEDGSIHPENEGNCDCEYRFRFDGNGDEILTSSECECGGAHFGKEIVLTFKYGNWDFVKAICQKLNRVGARVNKTCGLHVHFDARHLTARQVTTLGKRVARTIPALKQILPKSRSQNRFCETDINTHSGRGCGRGWEARYSFVNLMSYGRHRTLEIRGHSGTTDATKIINWIRILRVIMDKRSTVEVKTVSELMTLFRFDLDLIQYIAARYAKFNGQVIKPGSEIDDVSHDNQHTDGQIELAIAGQGDAMMDAIRYILTNVPEGPTPESNNRAVA